MHFDLYNLQSIIYHNLAALTRSKFHRTTTWVYVHCTFLQYSQPVHRTPHMQHICNICHIYLANAYSNFSGCLAFHLVKELRFNFYPETYLKQWPGFRPLTKQPDMFRELFLKARIEIEMSLMRERKRERWRINVKRSSPPFPASKIVTKVNKVPICTSAQIGSQFDLCPSRGETAAKQCSWSVHISSSSFHWSRKCFWLLALSSLEIHIFMDFLLLSIH